MGAPVLLVHDDIATIAAVRRLLSRESLEVELATSVADAITSFSHQLPELVVLAPTIEGGGGRHLLSELAQLSGGHQARVLLLGEGIEGYRLPSLPLPLEGADFLEKVRALLSAPPDSSTWSAQPEAAPSPGPLENRPTETAIPAAVPESWQFAMEAPGGSASGPSPAVGAEDGDLEAEIRAEVAKRRRAREALQAQKEAAAASDARSASVSRADHEGGGEGGRTGKAETERAAPVGLERELFGLDDALAGAEPELSLDEGLGQMRERLAARGTPGPADARNVDVERAPASEPTPPRDEAGPGALVDERGPAPLLASAAQPTIRAEHSPDDWELPTVEAGTESGAASLESIREDETTTVVVNLGARAGAAHEASAHEASAHEASAHEASASAASGHWAAASQASASASVSSRVATSTGAAGVSVAIASGLTSSEPTTLSLGSTHPGASQRLSPTAVPVVGAPVASTRAPSTEEGLERRGSHAGAPQSLPLSGGVGSAELTQLLVSLVESRRTVRLELRANDALRVLWLHRGGLVGATSNLEHESVLHRARRDGLLDARQERELRLMRGSGTADLLEMLRGRGYLREVELAPLARRHVEQLVLEALSEVHSDYRLSEDSTPPPEVPLVSARPVLPLALEGLRRGLEGGRVLEQLGGLEAVVTLRIRVEGLEWGLTQKELRFVAHLASGENVHELLSASGLPHESALRLLGAFQALGYLDVEVPAQPSSPGSDGALEVARLDAKFAELDEADYFSMLGLTRSAGAEEVLRAFHFLAAEFDPLKFVAHPDASLQRKAKAVHEALSEAVQALQDDRLRSEYARHLVE